MVISLLLVALLISLALAAILGWTADSRDDSQKLWPLEGTRPNNPMPATAVPTTSETVADVMARRSLPSEQLRPPTRRSP